MSTSAIVLGLLLAGLASYFIGAWRARNLARHTEEKLHSRPGYFGGYLAVWTVLPALVLSLIWGAAEHSVVRTRSEEHTSELQSRLG